MAKIKPIKVLQRRLMQFFPPSSIQRGDDYYHSGAVHNLRYGRFGASAEVRGSRAYLTSFDWTQTERKGVIGAHCTCPHFDDGNLCKHLWALALELDRRQVPGHLSLPRRLELTLAAMTADTSDVLDANYVPEHESFGAAEDFTFSSQASAEDDLKTGEPEKSAAPLWREGSEFFLVLEPKHLDEGVVRLRPYSAIPVPTAKESRHGKTPTKGVAKNTPGAWLEPQPLIFPENGDLPLPDQTLRYTMRAVCTLARSHGSAGEERSSSSPSRSAAAARTRAFRFGRSRPRHHGSRFGGSLTANMNSRRNSYYNERGTFDPSVLELTADILRPLLPALLETGRVFADKADFLTGKKPLSHLRFEGLFLPVTPASADGGYRVEAKVEVTAPEKTDLPYTDLTLFVRPALYRFGDAVGFLDLTPEERSWLKQLNRDEPYLHVAKEDTEAFVELAANRQLQFLLPSELQWKREELIPQAHVELRRDRFAPSRDRGRYVADIKFKYGPRTTGHKSPSRVLADGLNQRLYPRSPDGEGERMEAIPKNLLHESKADGELTLPAKSLADFVTTLLQNGIPVTVENQSVHGSSEFSVSVKSGIDWFDLDGEAGFGAQLVKAPAVLEAIRRGEVFLPLADGSLGLLDRKLRERLEMFTTFGEFAPDGEHLRFSKAQALLLNALLEAENGAKMDQTFLDLRARIRGFTGIRQSRPGRGFSGELRAYQQEGLGWLEFLESFGLGGILADDMGLGKTIQCLAFLEKRRDLKSDSRLSRLPSLILAPKSLLENWKLEAEKFTPGLRVTIHAGSDRKRFDPHAPQTLNRHLQDFDLVVSTYQTMLRDIEWMRQIEWDAVILDEAQAIKNPGALIAKAAKILPANFRLAMTGTPIENSLLDLFSISDFINPGFLHIKNLSRRSVKTATDGGESAKLDADVKTALAAAFKPVILRRTKEQVLKDLPEKTEQLITVELEGKQLKTYNELKRFYQSHLLKDVHDKGIKRSQIQILAALTRLRQAALHPGLIDPGLSDAKSSKFEVVLEMLDEIVAEGHRVLIFSQFTSLLALLKKELKARKIAFLYLDGKTAKRQAVVDEFKQSACPVFLMSLKAGGVGLNLVEADYVFLLDPWWNPAVEAQAIDRVHRIGQKRAVNAYRIIAKNTVEEKILELQKTKLGISSEIIDDRSSLVRTLTAHDLENLLA